MADCVFLKTRLWLIKAQGKFRHAERYCARLMDLGGPERERAKQMMRELRGFGAAWADVDPMALLQA